MSYDPTKTSPSMRNTAAFHTINQNGRAMWDIRKIIEAMAPSILGALITTGATTYVVINSLKEKVAELSEYVKKTELRYDSQISVNTKVQVDIISITMRQQQLAEGILALQKDNDRRLSVIEEQARRK